MVMLEVDRKALQKEMGKAPLSLEDLEGTLFDMGMELESATDTSLFIGITPDRPDLVSLYGLARALKAYKGIRPGLPAYTATKGKYRITIEKAVEGVRPFTAAAVVKGLAFDDAKIKEMIWVQEKLHDTLARGRKRAAIGIYPLERITWPITYTALDPKRISFQPLESIKEMNGLEILEEHPAGRAYRHLLEGKKMFPIFRDAKGEVLSMPPIINSHTTGKVTKETRDIFIECSGSNMGSLHALLKILVAMFADMGGQVFQVGLDYPDKTVRTPDLTPEEKTVTLAKINAAIGHDFTLDDAKRLLERMLYGAEKKGKDALTVSIPAFRSDIWHEIDIIDDVARSYGLNNLSIREQHVRGSGKELPDADLKRKAAGILIGAGMTQAFTLALTSKEDQFARMNLPESPHIALGTAAEKGLNMVRVALLPELMKALQSNRNREYPQRIFEIGDVVLPDPARETRAKNMARIAAAVAHPQAGFSEIKQVLTYLCECVGASCDVIERKDGRYIEGRCGDVIINKKVAGTLGEVGPEVLSRWGIEMPVAAFECDFDAFFP